MTRSPGAPQDEAGTVELLRDMLRMPGRYVERRTDEIRDLSSTAVEWTVRLQIRLPEEPDGLKEGSPRLVSLGIFPKKRLPDLCATDASGTEVPLLRRVDRTRALTALLLQDVLASLEISVKKELEAEERILAGLAYEFVSERPSIAKPAFEEYKTRLLRLAPSGRDIEAHLAFAAHFVTNTHVLAVVSQTPTRYHILTYAYSERHELPTRPSWEKTAGRGGYLLLLRYWGMVLGLLAVPFDMKLSGANHAHSYYLLVSSPAGIETEALYWRFLVERPRPRRAASGDGEYIHESKRDALACYHPQHDVRGGRARVDLRLKGTELRLLWLLNLVLVAVGLYLSRNTDKDLGNIMSVLAAVPAGLVAFATQTNHELTAQLGKWVRREYLLLALIAALAGLAVIGDLIAGDGRVAGFVDDRRIAALLASYGALLLGMLTYISFRQPGLVRRRDKLHYSSYSAVRGYRVARRRNSLLVMVGSVALAIGCGFFALM